MSWVPSDYEPPAKIKRRNCCAEGCCPIGNRLCDVYEYPEDENEDDVENYYQDW